MKQRRMCHFSPAEGSSALASCLKFRHLRSPPGYAPHTLREIARSFLCKNSRVLKGDEVIALLARLRLCVALSEGRFYSVGHLDLFRVRQAWTS